MRYAEYVYGYIIDAIKFMRTQVGGAIDAVCKKDLEELKASVPAGVLYRSTPTPTMIWLSESEEKFGNRSFSEAFAQRREDHILELQERIEELEQQEQGE